MSEIMKRCKRCKDVVICKKDNPRPKCSCFYQNSSESKVSKNDSNSISNFNSSENITETCYIKNNFPKYQQQPIQPQSQPVYSYPSGSTNIIIPTIGGCPQPYMNYPP